MSTAITILLVTTNIAQIIVLFNVENLLKKRNLKLMQFYLDIRFISKLIHDNLYAGSSSEFCQRIISDIMEYYDLKDLIILDYVNEPISQSDLLLRREILEFINQNNDTIKEHLEEEEFMKIRFHSITSKNLLLYISALKNKDSQAGVIICVGNNSTLLGDAEIYTLKSCLDLLRTRLTLA